MINVPKVRPPKILNEEKIYKLKELFPESIIDGQINIPILKQVLEGFTESDEETTEHYGLNWKGKKEARKIANTPSKATLKAAIGEGIDEDNTQNIYIEGENLEALKVLQKSYNQSIDFIYIDPPYNTGTDLLYKNDFADDFNNYLKLTNQVDSEGFKLSSNTEVSGRFHSDWLSMMYARLYLAKNLLKNDGVICVTIDDYEMSRLWLILDEIFGEENHLGTVVIRINPKGRMTSKKFSLVHEYGLFYGRSPEAYIKKLPVTPGEKSHTYVKDSDGTYYVSVNLRKQGVDSSAFNKKGQLSGRFYPIYFDPKTGKISTDEVLPIKIEPIDPNGEKRIWRRGKEAINEMYLKGDLWAKENRNGFQLYYKFRGGLDGRLAQSIWYDSKFSASEYGTKEVDTLLGKRELFSYPKSPFAISESILSATSSKDAVILDFFSGSATTAQSVIQLNVEDGGSRKFIMVQLPESTGKDSEAAKAGYKTICEIGKERIRRVVQRERKNNPNSKIDLGFKVYKLTKSNYREESENYKGTDQAGLEDLLENNIITLEHNWQNDDLLNEILLLEGFPLTSKLTKLPNTSTNNVTEVSSPEIGFKLLVCLDQKVPDDLISNLTFGDKDVFICLDNAVSDETKLRLADKGMIKTI